MANSPSCLCKVSAEVRSSIVGVACLCLCMGTLPYCWGEVCYWSGLSCCLDVPPCAGACYHMVGVAGPICSYGTLPSLWLEHAIYPMHGCPWGEALVYIIVWRKWLNLPSMTCVTALTLCTSWQIPMRFKLHGQVVDSCL